MQELLLANQHQKCYLCEQRTGKSFQIDHLRAQAANRYPELKYTWTNLFLVCPFCNQRKSEGFDVLDPTLHNIEDIIIQRIDYELNEVKFESTHADNPHIFQTIQLLGRLFNGKYKIRKPKEQILYKCLQWELVFFMSKLNDYKMNGGNDPKEIIISSLHISKEFLGFKFWIIKDSGLYDEFKEYMVWNKTV